MLCRQGSMTGHSQVLQPTCLDRTVLRSEFNTAVPVPPLPLILANKLTALKNLTAMSKIKLKGALVLFL